jgi:hypothetical protein
MDFKELMQKMQQIDEGLTIDPAMEECDGMPAAIIQGGHPPEESLNMNLTINSKGADGIRELIDVLKGIGSNNDPTDDQHDDSEIVIGDNYENSVDDDAGPHTYGTDAVIFKGNDMHNKGRKSLKVNGGENPQFHESIISNLSALYEEIKGRTALSEMSPEEKQAAQDAFFAKGGTVKHGKSKRTKKDRMIGRLPGEHESGVLHSVDAKVPPRRASRHDHVNVASKKGEITPDWEDRLNRLAAVGDEDRARKAAERDAKDREDKDNEMKSFKKLQRLNRSLVKDL